MAETQRSTLGEILSLGRDPTLTPAEKALWLAYRSYETKDGAWPEDETLAAHLGKGARSIQAYRSSLLQKGYLVQVKRGPNPAIYYAVVPQDSAKQKGGKYRRILRNKGGEASQDSAEQASQDSAIQGGVVSQDVSQPVPQDSATLPHTPSVEEYGKYGKRGSSASNNHPPTRQTRARRADLKSVRKRARRILTEHCLLGRSRAVDENGQEIGVGLLLRQLEDLLSEGWDPDDVLGAIQVVRRDESAPPADAAFSLRWFNAQPGRWARCIGAYQKTL